MQKIKFYKPLWNKLSQKWVNTNNTNSLHIFIVFIIIYFKIKIWTAIMSSLTFSISRHKSQMHRENTIPSWTIKQTLQVLLSNYNYGLSPTLSHDWISNTLGLLQLPFLQSMQKRGLLLKWHIYRLRISYASS